MMKEFVTCLINFIWVNSCRNTCFPNLVVIDLTEIEISILTWIPWRKLSSPTWSTIFKIRNTDLQFHGYGSQESKKEEKKNTGYCKAFFISPKRKNRVPFTRWTGEINNTKVDNAEWINMVMLMYDLIKYSDSYSKTSGSLWWYCRDEHNATLIDSESFTS